MVCSQVHLASPNVFEGELGLSSFIHRLPVVTLARSRVQLALKPQDVFQPFDDREYTW